nr:MAG TPA: hypothetical protein [Caudoviricetes sp.]
MPFVPVYKDFIGIIQFYRSVSPSDFHRVLLNSENLAYIIAHLMVLLFILLFTHQRISSIMILHSLIFLLFL